MNDEIKKRAVEKLERIIQKYGDENGERKNPQYLETLVTEQEKEMSFMSMANEIANIFREAGKKHENL